MDVLKTFAYGSSTSSLKERNLLFNELFQLLSDKTKSSEIPEASYKGLGKLIYYLFPIYINKKSRDNLSKLINILIKNNCEQSLKTIIQSFESHSKQLIDSYPNRNASLLSLYGIDLLNDLIIYLNENNYSAKLNSNNDEFKQIVIIYANFAYTFCFVLKQKVFELFYKKFKYLCKKVPSIENEFKNVFLSLNTDNLNIQSLVLSSFLIKYFNEHKIDFNELKNISLDVYIKYGLNSRVKLNEHLIKSCNLILKYVTHDDFKEKLLPTIQRLVLRNPEITLEFVCFLLNDLSIDLSVYSTDLIKLLASQLLAKLETNQQESANAIKSLSKQCSDNEAVLNLIKHLFFILNGGEGKLSTASQKCIVLQAIGNVSHNCATSTQELLIKLIESFCDYFKTETHEATLLCALQQLNNWFLKIQLRDSLNNDSIKKINDSFKKLFEIKTFTPFIRSSVINSINTLYTKNSIIENIVNFVPILLPTIEKSINQFTQTPLMQEAISASLLLTTLLSSDLTTESKMPNLINLLCDTKRQLFTNEKFYTNANSQALKDYCGLFSKLNSIVSLKDNLDLSSYYNGLVYILFNSKYDIRKTGQNMLSQIFKWSGSKLAIQLFDCADNLILNKNIIIAATNTETTTTNEIGEWPFPKAICECALTFVSIPNLTKTEIELLALKSLTLTNNSLALSFDPNLYDKCLYKLLTINRTTLNDTNILDLIKSKMDSYIHLTTDGQLLNESQINSMKTLARIDTNDYLAELLKIAFSTLKDQNLLNVTKQEYDIMKLSNNDLYDKSIIESALKAQESQSQMNIKRENKAYSYKEQLAEIELRKELESKKAASSGAQKKIDPSKGNVLLYLDQIKSHLTKKQLETLEQQIQKEKRIRAQVKQLDLSANKACQIIVALIEANPRIIIENNIFDLVNIIIDLIKTPLCSGYMFSIYNKLSNIMYRNEKKSFGESIVSCTFRLSNSPFELEARWFEEPLDNSYKRLINSIRSSINHDFKQFNINISISAFLLPFFYFCWSKIRDEDLISAIIDVIYKFSLVRTNLQNQSFQKIKFNSIKGHNHHHDSIDDDDEDDLNDKVFLLSKAIKCFPSSSYISLLLRIIANNDSIKVQNDVNVTLKEIFKFTSQLDLSDYEENFAKLVKERILYEFNEIINNLLSATNTVRETCLDCIRIVYQSFKYFEHEDYDSFVHRIWVCCYDVDENNKNKAIDIWKICSMKTDQKLCKSIINDVVHPLEPIRLSSAEALAVALKNHLDIVPDVMSILLEKYKIHNKIPQPKLDQYGRSVVSQESLDEWESRSGIANALVHLAELIPSNYVVNLYKFFINDALNDRNEIVKSRMLEAAIAALNHHGNSHKNELFLLFETYLESIPKSADSDAARQNIVILMGTLAKHLDKDDPKIGPIIGKLVQALQTPSQQVQESVANCLPPLMASVKAQIPTYVNTMMNVLLTAQTYGERRGAAYGLAGMLKGVGVLSLRQLNILQRLNDAVNNKNDSKQRESALFAYEMLTVMFNKVFEPFSVEILPNLLLCFGDSDSNVRAAADDCAKVVMSNLTSAGVKLILPKLLERLGEDESWRTKCGSVELLGAMAHCAPKQLSACLPNIVPKLIEILSDSHFKVQEAGTQALKQIGSVIKNPEIQNISPILLEALQDPAKKTQKALQVLLATKFVHFIDAASLALIMPVVQRAFQDRSTETRKMAAQIMGNMYSLTDQKDLQPYLPSILPGLKLSLLDPVPEVRSVSAKALGSMIRTIGDTGLNEIVSWLMEKLVSENSSVDRSGAAQGLSEVFGALGVAKLHKSMPEIIERAEQADLSPFVRDGYIMMFIYLPLTFTDEFTPFVGKIIPPILKALADDCEFVRDTALKAGQRIVNTYAETAISLFLPELEKGLFDVNWRIRYSSVQLLGDLLYKLSGVIGKMSTESSHDDDNFGTETGSKTIAEALGGERRNRVYAGLYMGRSDVSLLVRQAALHVWKIIVSNTPKTLKEILPTLFNLLLGCLASPNADKRQIAAATLVDIVRKLGERILPDILPILENGLNSERSEQRQGVCIGLTEIMASTSKDNILAFSDSLIPTVRQALMDPLAEVRSCAAKTFDNLHSLIGLKALEEVSVHLLNEMKKNENDPVLSERCLDGLKQMMYVKSRVLLPYLIPYLTQPPVNIHALCKLCCCASVDVLSRHLSKILNTLVQALSVSYDNENLKSESWVQECESLLLSINDYDGVKTIINELLNYFSTTTDVNSKLKLASLDMLTWFCSKTKADYSGHLDDLTKSLLLLFSDSNELVVIKAWDCLNCVIEPLKGNNLLQRLPTIRQVLRSLIQQQLRSNPTNKNYYIRGFCLPKKGITCILPIFKEGLLNGTPELKEQSAQTLCDCIKLADGDSLKSCVMAVTGPLIRVLGERYSWNVKSAVLDSIYQLLIKVDVTLRPFLPQLQPTFLKALNDPNHIVRLKSGYGLSKLLFMNPKFDQIIIEIHNSIKSSNDNLILETSLNTLRLCINNIGNKLPDETKKQIFQTLKSESFLYNEDQQIRNVCAGALGSLAVHLNDQDFNTLFTDIADFKKYLNLGWKYLHSNSMVVAITLLCNTSRLMSSKHETEVLSFISNCVLSDRVAVCMSAMRTIGFLLFDAIKNNGKIEIDLATSLAKCINNNSNDVKQLSVEVVTYIAVNANKPLDTSLLRVFIPMLVNGTKERSPTVRSKSEIALVNLLHLNQPNTILEDCLNLMDKMRESLADCVKSISKDTISQPSPKDIDIDETLLKIDS